MQARQRAALVLLDLDASTRECRKLMREAVAGLARILAEAAADAAA